LSASAVCPSCGTLNLPANLFCTNCGVRLVPAAAVTASPATSPQATPPGIPPTAPSGFPAAGGAYPYFPPPPQRANAPNILSGMFDVWAKNFLNFLVVFLSLAFLNALIAALLAFAILGTFVSGSGVLPAPAGFTGSSLGALLVLSAGTFVSAVILNSAVIGGMTEYAVRRYRGEAVPLERALRRGFDRFLSILGANFLLTMLTFGLIILPLLLILYGTFLVGGSANPGSAIGLLCGGLAALAVGGLVALYLSIALSLYAPAIMMENKRAVDGLMRSRQITKGYRWSPYSPRLWSHREPVGRSDCVRARRLVVRDFGRSRVRLDRSAADLRRAAVFPRLDDLASRWGDADAAASSRAVSAPGPMRS